MSAGDQLGQFPLGSGRGDEEELVAGTRESAEPQPIETQDVLEMGEEHLRFLRCRRETAWPSVLAISRAMSWAPSWMLRGIA